MHAKLCSSNNLHHRENADRDHQAETQKRSWQPKLTAQPLRSNCVHNLGLMSRARREKRKMSSILNVLDSGGWAATERGEGELGESKWSGSPRGRRASVIR